MVTVMEGLPYAATHSSLEGSPHQLGITSQLAL